MPEKIIGIDLGTTSSAAAVVIGGRPVIIPSSEGLTPYGKYFPSYVAITKDGQLLVGEPARRQAVMNPEGTVTGWKRKMGTDYKYVLHGKEFTPQQLSAFLLQKIKRDAEAFLGEPVKKAVITVPAYFNDNQRQATKDAATIAGLEVVRLINEPTAAALAYGLDKLEQELRILVFDLGGGTLDVTIMEMGQGVFEVKATSGDTQLGGRDMDEVLTRYVVEEFRKQTGIDLTRDQQAMTRVREAVEKAKIELSSVYETEINLPFIAYDSSGPKHLQMTLTRAKLEELVRPVVERCRGPIMQALQDAKMRPEDIDKIILIGGPTRMPIIREFLKEVLGKEPERGVDPMEAVAIGAAIQGAIISGELTGKDIVLLDVTPLTLGVEVLGGLVEPIIERNTTIPVRKSKIFTTAADFQTSVVVHVVQGERPLRKGQHLPRPADPRRDPASSEGSTQDRGDLRHKRRRHPHRHRQGPRDREAGRGEDRRAAQAHEGADRADDQGGPGVRRAGQEEEGADRDEERGRVSDLLGREGRAGVRRPDPLRPEGKDREGGGRAEGGDEGGGHRQDQGEDGGAEEGLAGDRSDPLRFLPAAGGYVRLGEEVRVVK